MAKKFNSKEVKGAKKVVSNILFSPFQVRNYINKSMDHVTELGITIREMLDNHGFTHKKLQLTDLFQVDGRVCTLERYCKVDDFDPLAFWLDQVPACEYLYVSSVCVPHEFVKIGSYYYRAIPAENSVEAFFKSLDAVTMIREEHERRASQIEDLLFKKEEKERKAAEREAAKAAKKEGKVTAKVAEKAKKARNEEVARIIAQLKAVPVCAKYTPYQLAKTALTMYRAA